MSQISRRGLYRDNNVQHSSAQHELERADTVQYHW